ncbi:MAG: Asp-tRNA(Asn)/Glu-tRNA(Gln) amidotransferase GatCAB subunit B [Acidobacteria bacterium]|nr:MAG: Asp-tRNA(Asn)/Glu-tRNA(Gln) amidotransferase GatCAB subunit B [Acidobacteriota bacterium]
MTHSYEAVIGLECHAQLLTNSKLFCSCSTKFGETPNMNTCPVCLGLPGALPVLNRTAVGMAVKAAVGLDCRINAESQWARKNYFYPDLPKGYQISQYDRPLAQHGFIEIFVNGTAKKIGVQRIHMEEDAGKSLHEGFQDSGRNTYLDFNRSGVPLIEIVSEPDLRSSAEAYDYLARLKQVLEFLEVCDGNMEEGSLRCDANVSVRRTGEEKFGTRTELKNINSFRFVQKAIDYEVNRQIEVLEGGGRIIQETRLWNSTDERSVSMRSKEEAHDYRYFPDPDLPLLAIDAEWIQTTKRSMPELPEARRRRFIQQFALSEYDAGVLTSTRALADFFEQTAQLSGQPKTAANWIMGDLLRFYKDGNTDLKDLSKSTIAPKMLAEMIALVEKGTISGKIAKTVIEEMHRTGKEPQTIIEEKGLVQISDAGEIEKIVNKVIEDNPKSVEQYRAGKTGTLGFFVGQVMKVTGGRANPQTVNDLLRKKLAG